MLGNSNNRTEFQLKTSMIRVKMDAQKNAVQMGGLYMIR